MSDLTVSTAVDEFMQSADAAEMRAAVGLEILHLRYTGSDQLVLAEDFIAVQWDTTPVANTGGWEVPLVSGDLFGFVTPRPGYYEHSILIPIKGVDTGTAAIAIRESGSNLMYLEDKFEVTFSGAYAICKTVKMLHEEGADIDLIVSNQDPAEDFSVGRRNPGSRMEWIIEYKGAA